MQYYVPVGQERGFSGSWLIVRPKGEVTTAWPALREALQAADPEIRSIDVRILSQGLAGEIRPFRLGMVAGLICYTAFLLLPLALYRLLSPYGKQPAVLMVAFAVVSVPIAFAATLDKFEVLTLLSGADYLQAFSVEELQARVMWSLDAYGDGLLVTQIFWGLWLLPFGYLVFKSGILPKTLGILLMLGCFGYLINFTGRVLFPGYAESGIAGFVRLPAALGEIGICLWLLVMGAREPKTE